MVLSQASQVCFTHDQTFCTSSPPALEKQSILVKQKRVSCMFSHPYALQPKMDHRLFQLFQTSKGNGQREAKRFLLTPLWS